jgi:glycosyltransferase involved in cell wall biosynthesis
VELTDGGGPARAGLPSAFQPRLASVLINNHNYGRFLAEAIESALDQTYAPLEVIVVDDGSSDESLDVITLYGDRITPVLISPSRGQYAAINAGLAASSGEFVFLLDSDDVFASHKVEDVVATFEGHRAAGAYFHRREMLIEGNLCDGPLLEIDGLHDLRAPLAAGRVPFISTTMSAMCFRRSALEAVGPLPELPSSTLGDHYLKWATFATMPVYFDQRPLSAQRLHDHNRYTRPRSWKEIAAKESTVALWMRRKIPESRNFSQVLIVQSVARHLRHARSPFSAPGIDVYLREAGNAEAATLLLRGVAATLWGAGRRLGRPQSSPLKGICRAADKVGSRCT